MGFETVRDVAVRIIRLNAPYYAKDLLALIPEAVLGISILKTETLYPTSLKIDGIRFKKEEDLARMMGLSNYKKSDLDWEKLKEAINSEPDTLPRDQEAKKREIKFLSNVAQKILHL